VDFTCKFSPLKKLGREVLLDPQGLPVIIERPPRIIGICESNEKCKSDCHKRVNSDFVKFLTSEGHCAHDDKSKKEVCACCLTT
ncbi:hypothetical protein MKW92_001614, partial [Papaver armeniacum]